MLILNNRLPSQYFFAGETPSGDQAEVKSEKPKTVDLSQQQEVINKSDRIDVAEQAKRTIEIASYKAAYTKLEDLAKNYAQELNQNMKMDEAIKVRALADQIGDTIQYQCDERSFDSVHNASGKRWVDVHMVEQYKQLYDLIGQSPLASKDNLMTQIGRIKIPAVKGTTTAQEIMAFRLEKHKSEELAKASSFGMIGLVEGINSSDDQKKTEGTRVASAGTEKKKDKTVS